MTEERLPYEIDGEQPAPQRRQKTPGVLFPILLIGAGLVVLLENLGVVNVSWPLVLRFWPVALIIVGLDVIFGRWSRFGRLIVVLASLAALGGLLWVSASPERVEALGVTERGSGKQVSGSIEEALGDVERLQVEVDLSVSELVLGAQTGQQYAAQGDYATDSLVEPVVRYDTRGNRGDLVITQPSELLSFPFGLSNQNRISLNLPTGVPIDLTVRNDMGGLTLDLSRLDIRSLTVEDDMGAVTVTLPRTAEMDTVSVSSDMGAVTVNVPDGAAFNARELHVESGSGAVTVNLPSSGSLGDVSASSDMGAVRVIAPDDASLSMKSLSVDSGSGAVKVTLPREGSLGNVSVEADMGELVIEMSGGGPVDLLVASLTVDSGSGAVRVTLPNKGDYDASISADMGSVTVSVPDGLEVRVEISTDMGSKQVSNQRFSEIGRGIWETGGYAGASDRVQLTIDSGAGGVTVR